MTKESDLDVQIAALRRAIAELPELPDFPDNPLTGQIVKKGSTHWLWSGTCWFHVGQAIQ